MVSLIEIIEYIKPEEIINFDKSDNVEITGISYNSKTTKNGDIFICLVGEHVDGHAFIKDACKNGASAIITERNLDNLEIPILVTKNTQLVLSQIAALFYNFPSQQLNLIGITGTNGKTTVSHLVENIFEQAGYKCGLIGTLGNRLSSKDDYISTNHTTPQAPELQKSLKEMLDSDIKHVVMEVSSHSIEQYRVNECNFSGAVFTNLTQDHLDYHITMENYFKAKSKLFSTLDEGKYAVINKDDPSAHRFIKITPEKVRVLTYGINNKADIMAQDVKFSTDGSNFTCITPIGTIDINLLMAGQFSVYNALAALAVGIAENIDLHTCKKALENTQGVAGRFEVVIREPLVIVDYAHTPDGLLNILNAAKKILPEDGNLICLFGCGGNRDTTKRPKMGKIAEKIADKIIITSDNPRAEDPQQIITDILTGIKSLNSEKIKVEIDRKAAIMLAIKIANKNDIVVLAGKGHENYQILKDKTIYFNDKDEALAAFTRIKSNI